MGILQLEVKNVKKIVVLDIMPDGSLVVIGGENGAGKSTVLDSIMYALGGKSLMPERPLRDGADHGEVVVTLEGGLIAKRTFTKSGGGELTLCNADGAKYPRPQERLDALLGQLSFDPLEFVRMSDPDKRETLRVMVGIDLSQLEALKTETYQERTEVNRRVRDLEGQLARMPQHDGVPLAETSVMTLLEELEAARLTAAAYESMVTQVEQAGDVLQTAIERQEHAAAQAQAWLDRAEAAEGEVQEARGVQLTLVAGRDAAKDGVIPLEPITEQISNAEATNSMVRDNAAREKVADTLVSTQEASAELTTKLTQIDAEVSSTMAEAEMPIEGLSFDETGVTYNSFPFSQASQAEQLRVSVAMGLALNPTLKILLIRDGSLLDKNSLAMVAQMAEEAGAQVWLERVGDEGDVVMQDGMVKSQGAAEVGDESEGV